MRTILTIAFLAVYLLLTAGIQVAHHTCGDETTADVMPLTGEDPCGCGDEPAQDRCCTVEVVTIHLDDAQQGVSMIVRPDDAAHVDYVIPRGMPVRQDPSPKPLTVDTSPRSAPSSFLLHCAFLI